MNQLDASVQAANRLMHMDYPDDLTSQQRAMRAMEDAQMCAGALILICSHVSWTQMPPTLMEQVPE